MRVSIMVITAMAVLFPNVGKSEKVRDPGAGFIDQKRTKAGKNFYVVRDENGCTIKAGKFGDTPAKCDRRCSLCEQGLCEGGPQGDS